MWIYFSNLVSGDWHLDPSDWENDFVIGLMNKETSESTDKDGKIQVLAYFSIWNQWRVLILYYFKVIKPVEHKQIHTFSGHYMQMYYSRRSPIWELVLLQSMLICVFCVHTKYEKLCENCRHVIMLYCLTSTCDI